MPCEESTAEEQHQPGSVSQHSNSRRFPRGRLRCLAAGISLLIAVFSAELLLRVYVAARGWTSNCYVSGVTLLVPDAVNGYSLARNYRFRSSSMRISTNAFGLRGPAIALEKPSGVQRVAILGGSSVFGYLVDDGEEACRRLEDRLRADGLDAEVINAGVPGYNLVQSLSRFRTVVAPLKPDLVVLYLGWNDLVYVLSDTPEQQTQNTRSAAAAWERLAAHSVLYGIVVHRLFGRTARFTPPEHANRQPTPAGREFFLKILADTVQQIQSTGAEVLICSQATLAHPDVDPSQHPHLGDSAESAQEMILVGSWLRDTLKEFAELRNLPFLDVYNLIPPTEAMLGDNIHLTRSGEQRLAELLADRMSDLLMN
ncbi:MAG: hypothetical protein KDA89_12850 [Planctomycetaceae bacterium]|nr:hypothetical protein [Planctomycetaceae bacterium]